MIRWLIRNVVGIGIVLLAALLPLTIGFVWFAENLPAPTDDPAKTDAIVVLTGGADRISTGIALLEAGKAKRLFVSGVDSRVGVPELLKIARAAPQPGESLSGLAAKIDLGHEAGDTFGNAVETAAWMSSNHFTTMRLVTADYHMRRALIEFRLDAPDIFILPNPVRPPSTEAGRWWRNKPTRDLLLSEYGKYVIARWRYVLSRLAEDFLDKK